MEINITEFQRQPAFHYSRSVMEGGANAGNDTWVNAKNDAPLLLKTPEQRKAFNDHVRGYGAWTEEEIRDWSDIEANALFVQFIASDIREAGEDDLESIDWDDYREQSEAGQIAGSLFKTEAGEYYYTLGE